MSKWLRPLPDDWQGNAWPPPLTRDWWIITVFCSAIIGGFVIGGIYEAAQPSNSPGGGGGGYVAPVAVHDSDVTDVCHQQVLDLLKAPSTAQFSGDKVTGFGDNWTDVGNVDSENSFSAMIRNTYTCTAIHGVGLNWRVKVTGIQ